MIDTDELREKLLRACQNQLSGEELAHVLTAISPRREIKGFWQFLTINDVAIIIQRPVRYVREELVKTGILPAKKMGGNSWRIVPEDFEAWKRSGVTGARFARPSGGRRARG